MNDIIIFLQKIASWFLNNIFATRYHIAVVLIFVIGTLIFLLTSRKFNILEKGNRKYITVLCLLFAGVVFEFFWTPHVFWIRIIPYFLPRSVLTIACIALALWTLIVYKKTTKDKNNIVCRLGGFNFSLESFVRHTLITGKTGSGKSISAIRRVIHELFLNENKGKEFGGIAVDAKGNFFSDISKIAEHHKKSDRIIMLKVNNDDSNWDWEPPFKFNLLQYPSITWRNYAKIIVETASSQGQGDNDKGFFKNQAELNIQKALELQDILGCNPTIGNVYRILNSANSYVAFMCKILQNQDGHGKFISKMEKYNRRHFSDKEIASIKIALRQLTDYSSNNKYFNLDDIKLTTTITNLKEFCYIIAHFTDSFATQPPEQLQGVIATINNYTYNFTNPSLEEVFCNSKPNVFIEDIDKGKIFCISIPTKYAGEREYINTFLKLLYYTHANNRLSLSEEELAEKNLLVFMADECQSIITSSPGMDDSSTLDKIRQAKATILWATQSTTSFLPVLKQEKTKVLLLNISNHIYFQAADDDGAKLAANELGKKKDEKISVTRQNGGRGSITYSDEDKYIFKDYELRNMKKFECIIKHCEKGFKKVFLPPVGFDYKIPYWYTKSS